MKDKALEIFYIFFLYVNIFLLPTTKQQQPPPLYLPGQYSSDYLFLEDVPKQYIYKTGYYSTSAITNNYNNAQGIIFLHDNSVRTFNLKILFVVQISSKY